MSGNKILENLLGLTVIALVSLILYRLFGVLSLIPIAAGIASLLWEAWRKRANKS